MELKKVIIIVIIIINLRTTCLFRGVSEGGYVGWQKKLNAYQF